MNHPKAYQAIIDTINAAVHLQPKRKYNFVHLFVKNRAELGNYAEKAANSLDDDGYFWISYPKKSSKKYSSDISRDVGWEVLGQLNFEPVTQVSINEDWSALRLYFCWS